VPFVATNASRIHYEVAGSGPWLVLLHGAGGRSAAWIRPGWVQSLARDFTVVTVDARGTGRSDDIASPDEFGIDARVSDLKAVFDELEIDRAALFGFSMGGRHVVAFAAAYPERVRSIVVGGSNPHGPYENHRPRQRLRRPRRLTPRHLASAVWRRLRWRIDRYLVAPLRAWRSNDDAPEGSEFLELELLASFYIDVDFAAARLEMPALFFQGDRDEMFAPELTEAFANRLPNGEFVSLSGERHGILQRRALLEPIVRPFLLRTRDR
jgi:pimeloyl-ACP methyl ester carboxylesterase